ARPLLVVSKDILQCVGWVLMQGCSRGAVDDLNAVVVAGTRLPHVLLRVNAPHGLAGIFQWLRVQAEEVATMTVEAQQEDSPCSKMAGHTNSQHAAIETARQPVQVLHA